MNNYLTQEEKTLIVQLYNSNNDITTISKQLNRYCGTISNFLKSVKDIRIRGKTKYTMEQVQAILNKHGYILVSGYKNSVSKSFVCLCPKSHKYYATVNHFLKGGRCPKCMADRFRLPQDVVFNYIKSFKYMVISDKYINYSGKLKLICPNNHEIRITYSDFKKGYRCRHCFFNRNRGENHPNWKKDRNITRRHKQREAGKLTQWSKNIFIRDNYICQKCNKRGGTLNAHHINGYVSDELNRLNINNGVTLCKNCHKEIHHFCGGPQNQTTIIEYNQWNFNKMIDYTELFQLSFRFGVF